MHLPLDLGVTWYCVCCLSCASWKSWYNVHYFCSCHLWCWWSFPQFSLHTILNHLSQCHLGVRLDLCISEIVVPTPKSWDARDPSMTKNELFRPHSLLQRSPHFCFWLSSAAMLVCSSRVFPIILPLLLLHLVCNDLMNSLLFLQCDLHDICEGFLPFGFS